uniref:Polyisoprenoid diphosphate/phosphate phosphohydrolase PLPP6 n=1 Tax=Mola mola TaxID=94237 RepID=A0A3Q3XJI0_MOLML
MTGQGRISPASCQILHGARPHRGSAAVESFSFQSQLMRYSFPSGHATRAAMCARFLLAQLVDTASMRVLVLGWAAVVSLSRLLLARQYVTDVVFGLAMGYCQYTCLQNVINNAWT